jgi:hypothetical protein
MWLGGKSYHDMAVSETEWWMIGMTAKFLLALGAPLSAAQWG